MSYFASHARLFSFRKAILMGIACAIGCISALLLIITLMRAQHAMAYEGQPPMPAGVDATITLTLQAANTPTQTTLISVSNPTTATAAIGINFYRGLSTNNQLACTVGPDILEAGNTIVYTVTETPGCANQTFSGDAVLGANQAVTATALLQRITTHHVAPIADCGNVGRCYAMPQAAADIAETGDTIKVAQGVYTSQAFQVLFLNKGITLTGGYTKTNWTQTYPLTQPVVLDGQNNLGQRVVQVAGTGGGTLTLEGLVIRNGNLRSESSPPPPGEGGEGAGVNIVSGTVIIRNSQFISNVATSGGGVNSRGELTIDGTTFQDNEVGNMGRGASVYATGGSVVVLGSQFFNSRFVTRGSVASVVHGAIDSQSIPLTVRNTQIEATMGAAIYTEGGTLTVSNSNIRNNGSSGIYIDNANAQVLSNTIEFNGLATREGGGISFNSSCPGQLLLAYNVIRNNTASQGGGLSGLNGPMTLQNNTIQNNMAVQSGGALFLRTDGISVCPTPHLASLQSNRILDNRAERGGAILIDINYQVQSTNDIVANNVTSGFQTAAMHVGVGRLDLRHGTLVSNGRYAISTDSGTAMVTNTIVASHSVAGLAGNITSTRSLFFGNGSTCSNGASCPNDLAGDPRFFWPVANDYHVCQNSVAIDQGVSAGVNTDFENQTRPQGSSSDIGADEWNRVLCEPLRAMFLPIVIRSELS